jgi:hypothetical protein
VAGGGWWVASGQWSVVSGRWSVMNGLGRIRTGPVGNGGHPRSGSLPFRAGRRKANAIPCGGNVAFSCLPTTHYHSETCCFPSRDSVPLPQTGFASRCATICSAGSEWPVVSGRATHHAPRITFPAPRSPADVPFFQLGANCWGTVPAVFTDRSEPASPRPPLATASGEYVVRGAWCVRLLSPVSCLASSSPVLASPSAPLKPKIWAKWRKSHLVRAARSDKQCLGTVQAGANVYRNDARTRIFDPAGRLLPLLAAGRIGFGICLPSAAESWFSVFDIRPTM